MKRKIAFRIFSLENTDFWNLIRKISRPTRKPQLRCASIKRPNELQLTPLITGVQATVFEIIYLIFHNCTKCSLKRASSSMYSEHFRNKCIRFIHILSSQSVKKIKKLQVRKKLQVHKK